MNIDVIQLEIRKLYTISLDIDSLRVFGMKTCGLFFSRQIGKCNIETVALLCLDSTNKIINYSTVAIGGIANVVTPVEQILKTALLSNASKIVIAHNHPSGVLEITPQDISITKKIGYVCKLLHIELIDSLVVSTDENFISIREHIDEFK